VNISSFKKRNHVLSKRTQNLDRCKRRITLWNVAQNDTGVDEASSRCTLWQKEMEANGPPGVNTSFCLTSSLDEPSTADGTGPHVPVQPGATTS
jgi:hypothetical protein